MMKQISHMSQTMTDFRNFFKPSKKSIFSIKQSIEDVINLIEKQYSTNDIKIILECLNDSEIEGYPNEFKQIILNILNNAKDEIIKKNRENREIKIKIFKELNKSVISIVDKAGGIPIEFMNKIFEPYFTTKEETGTGIGLYMSKNIIEKIGGKIIVSNVDDGAEFKIEVNDVSISF